MAALGAISLRVISSAWPRSPDKPATCRKYDGKYIGITKQFESLGQLKTIGPSGQSGTHLTKFPTDSVAPHIDSWGHILL